METRQKPEARNEWIPGCACANFESTFADTGVLNERINRMGSPVSNCGSSFLQKSQKDSDTASMNSVEARDLLQQHQIDLKSKDMFSPEKDVNLQTLAAHEKSSALIKWLDKRLYLQNASALSGLLKIRQATASLIAKMTSKH